MATEPHVAGVPPVDLVTVTVIGDEPGAASPATVGPKLVPSMVIVVPPVGEQR